MGIEATRHEPAAVTNENEERGDRSRFTCPECSGTLWELEDGGIVKLRCRVGHSYTEETYVSELAHSLEAALWTAATALEEKADFCDRLARRLGDAGQEISARRYRDQGENARQQSERVRSALADLLAPPPLEEERAAS